MKITKKDLYTTWRIAREIFRMILKTKENIVCKYCGSMDIVRFGQYKGVQRYFCNACKRKFTLADTLPKMKTSIRIIADALSMYYGGMSLNAVSRYLEQEYGHPITNAGIYNWLIRFSRDAIELAKDYTPSVGDVWIADETALNIGKSHRIWFWDIIDAKTRFLLASHISINRTTADALKLMKQAEKRAGKVPQLVFTDKLQAYTDGIELAWGAETKHIPSKGFVKPMNTNLIERFHGSLKDRLKVMRGMKSIETARLLLDGWLVFYNFLRPHESLKGQTPAEKAGIKFPFKDWAGVVGSKREVTAIPEEAKYPPAKTYRVRAYPVEEKPKHKIRPKHQARQKLVSTSIVVTRGVK
jgi:putative transposase